MRAHLQSPHAAVGVGFIRTDSPRTGPVRRWVNHVRRMHTGATAAAGVFAGTAAGAAFEFALAVATDARSCRCAASSQTSSFGTCTWACSCAHPVEIGSST